MILDLDASLIEIHSENKEGTAANFKHGFGFHPLFCFADATGEAIGVMLRPGNATANDAAYLLAVLDTGIDQLPAEVAVGHRASLAWSVGRWWPVRTRRAVRPGSWEAAVSATSVFRSWPAAKPLFLPPWPQPTTNTNRWGPALRADRSIEESDNGRPVAMVAEVTDLVDLSAWPKGTRLIVRREPLHPGAQQSLLPDLEYRFWGHYTDLDGDPAILDRQMRAHAHVEDHIARLKKSGLMRFPFADLAANQAWLQGLLGR